MALICFFLLICFFNEKDEDCNILGFYGSAKKQSENVAVCSVKLRLHFHLKEGKKSISQRD